MKRIRDENEEESRKKKWVDNETEQKWMNRFGGEAEKCSWCWKEFGYSRSFINEKTGMSDRTSHSVYWIVYRDHFLSPKEFYQKNLYVLHCCCCGSKNKEITICSYCNNHILQPIYVRSEPKWNRIPKEINFNFV